MADFVRRLVSGNKARFRDEELDLELDLAYITDRIIVMGYPANGIEGLYRNRREDAKKFLDHRHGNNYWVFNFCPVKENSYPPEVFGGRVSRYPFPDHHAPPLAILPLIAREMRAWLDVSPDRVAVLHCKAGKGRSGTMACSYLLTLTDLPRSPSAGRSQVLEDNAKQKAEDLMNVMPADVDASVNAEPPSSAASATSDPIKHELSTPTAQTKLKDTPQPSRSSTLSTTSLDSVLDLHTAGRMKRPSSPSARVKPGVSIPSQRRWLYYWSLLLAGQGPPGLWTPVDEKQTQPKVRLTGLTLRMRELTGVKAHLLKAANALIDKAGRGKATGGSQVWASLARYDDDLVNELEWWERVTRAEDGNLGVRKPGSEHQPDGKDLSKVFADAKWDKGKMVRVFARLGSVSEDAARTEEASEDGKIVEYTMKPLSGDNWAIVKSSIEGDGDSPTVESEEDSIHDVTRTLRNSDGVVLDANREVRVKLYIGQVFMGWFWFIPTFHLPHPRDAAHSPTELRLTRTEIDFPLGVGAHIVDVAVGMEWCAPEADVVGPPARQDSRDSAEGRGDPTGLGASMQAAAVGSAEEAVSAAQVGDE